MGTGRGLAVAVILVGVLAMGGVLAYLWNPDILYELTGQAVPACKNPQGDEAVKRTTADAYEMEYSWHYKREDWRLSITVPKADYAAFQEEDRPVRTVRFQDGKLYRQPAYDLYVTHPGDDNALGTIADELTRIGTAQGWSKAEVLSFTLAFVQCLPYTSDKVTSGFDEYPRYPVETLVDAGGDCEDTSILYASLVLAMGNEAVLLSPPEHMGVGVGFAAGSPGSGFEHEGVWYLYAETTGDGFGIGDIPDEYAGTSVQVFDLDE